MKADKGTRDGMRSLFNYAKIKELEIIKDKGKETRHGIMGLLMGIGEK